ncbi:hypothetical protein DXG01_001355 [Tephrocybe rancida]|nr:hypothetical protein DXG01_001355 [Tephrocybe rancida]
MSKFKAATADMADHVIAHSELNASLPKDLLHQWTVEVEAWENNPSQPNPLVSVIDTPTQASVHQELAQAEATNVGTVNEILLDECVSPSVLITCGLDIEAEQRGLKVEASKIWQYSQDQKHTKLQLRCNALQRKINAWAKIQHVYIPGLAALCQAEEHHNKEHGSNTICLWLLSQIGSKISFDSHLADIEWKLRITQAYEALDAVQKNLQVRSHLYKFKECFVWEQHANMHAHNSIHGRG